MREAKWAVKSREFTWELAGSMLTISGRRAMPNYPFGGSPWNLRRNSITSVIINAGITGIGDWSFYDCSGLTAVAIPASVTSIGDGAFGWCRRLTSVAIPNAVTNIGEGAFYDCTALADVHVGWSSPDAVMLRKDVFSNIKSSAKLYVPNAALAAYRASAQWLKYFSAENIVEADAPVPFTWAFESGKLTVSGDCLMPDYSAAHRIPPGPHPWYAHRSDITSVVINDGITSIGNYAFYYCYQSTAVTIPRSVTSIGDSAFALWDGLRAVTIPASVTNIGNGAFTCCNLTDVHVGWNNPDAVTLGKVVFIGIEGNATLYAPIAALAAYRASARWLAYFSADNIIGE